jgi:hypothetical protein
MNISFVMFQVEDGDLPRDFLDDSDGDIDIIDARTPSNESRPNLVCLYKSIYRISNW